MQSLQFSLIYSLIEVDNGLDTLCTITKCLEKPCSQNRFLNKIFQNGVGVTVLSMKKLLGVRYITHLHV